MTQPIFSKRHYEFLARSLRLSMPLFTGDYNANTAWLNTIDRIASDLQDENPAFNRARFIEAATGKAHSV